MSGSNIDPHDNMRGRDVNKVARGEQAPQPSHEPGTVSKAPSNNKPVIVNNKSVDEVETAPVDWRFPFTNQTRHCYIRYLEYHKCIQEKGKDAPECEKFARYYRSLCPSEWIVRWNEQREHGTFPGPI